MQSVILGQYFLMDRTLKSVNFFNSAITDEEVCIYEVFRIQNNMPLFIEEHLKRLENSLKIANKQPIIRISQLSNRLKMLYAANNISDGNVKLDFRFMPDGEQVFMAYFIPSSYPTEEQRQKGIKCSLQFSERHHPNAKIYNPDVRGKANTIIEQRHVYETLLVNSDNCLTEGSRSNLFFINGNTLITADDSVVLPGIMRQHIISIIEALGLSLEYRCLPVEDISKMEAAFISGTSPRLLPVNQIGEYSLKVNHPLLQQLRVELEKDIAARLK
ncbi:aminotransferase class IV [Carboxylicivirga mesophila]|uniref:branched-chain-amino-acid transaminase n=1 Tax=Carboxylicivirga mesophila TaxID=1166478 RepID=A0ABS5KB47_9BACT|nr:aminotransferase class IV [Carboxylicivirga mesophila]MBS2211741.1 aminotransferase class IV [Carboxylicivirga mesophila]